MQGNNEVITLESVLLAGDLARLNASQKLEYHTEDSLMMSWLILGLVGYVFLFCAVFKIVSDDYRDFD